MILLQLHVRDGARNIAKIEEGLGELEGKLTYEKDKLQGYTADLNEAEKRQEPHTAAVWCSEKLNISPPFLRHCHPDRNRSKAPWCLHPCRYPLPGP